MGKVTFSQPNALAYGTIVFEGDYGRYPVAFNSAGISIFKDGKAIHTIPWNS